MLSFLQKYQKVFLGFVTFAIVASFALFGVLDLFERGGSPQVEDTEVGTLIDGSPLMDLELKRVCRFISTDVEDLIFTRGASVNLCNNGVLRRDLLFTGIGDLLVAQNFDQIKEDLSEKLQRVKEYRPYQNQEAPLISARAVWEKIVPQAVEKIDAVKGHKEVSVETFSQLSKIFMEQSSCPPELTRRFLSFYQSQMGKKDPYLMDADFAFFGFHSASDWFGESFIKLAATFILNGAKAATMKGFQVTKEEAKSDLSHTFEQSLKRIQEKDRLSLSLGAHLRSLGFLEKEAVEIWQKILLFRRYFESVSQGMILDQLPFKDFASFSRESSSIVRYEWPPEMDLKTGQDLIEFQVYLKGIGGKITGTDLPQTLLPIDTITLKTPELVQGKYKAKMGKTTVKEVGLRARVKEVLDFQLEAKNWEALCLQFSFLKKKNTNTERLEVLENLSRKNRLAVDQFVREKWVKSNLYAVEEQLKELQKEDVEISTCPVWISINGVAYPKALAKEFEKGATSFQFQDGETFYQFDAVEKIDQPRILTFKEARSLGVLERISNRFLEGEYQRIREIYPSQFQAKEGEWKTFHSVKEKVAQIVFENTGESLAKRAVHRLENPTRKALEALSKDPTNQTFLTSIEGDALLNQFKLTKKPMEIPKIEEDDWMKEKLHKMKPGSFSPVHVAENGKIYFFFFDKKTPFREPILEQFTLGKEILGTDAKRYVANQLIQKIAKEKK